MSLKNSHDTIGNQTPDLPVCSVVPMENGSRTIIRRIRIEWVTYQEK
jgi:hypothetical protein